MVPILLHQPDAVSLPAAEDAHPEIVPLHPKIATSLPGRLILADPSDKDLPHFHPLSFDRERPRGLLAPVSRVSGHLDWFIRHGSSRPLILGPVLIPHCNQDDLKTTALVADCARHRLGAAGRAPTHGCHLECNKARCYERRRQAPS